MTYHFNFIAELSGDNPVEEARADMVVDCVRDIFDECVNIIWEKHPQAKVPLFI